VTKTEKLSEMLACYRASAKAVEAIRLEVAGESEGTVNFALRLQADLMANTLNQMATIADWEAVHDD